MATQNLRLGKEYETSPLADFFGQIGYTFDPNFLKNIATGNITLQQVVELQTQLNLDQKDAPEAQILRNKLQNIAKSVEPYKTFATECNKLIILGKTVDSKVNLVENFINFVKKEVEIRKQQPANEKLMAITTVGDGNCGPNAFAFQFVRLIRSGNLELDAKKFAEFWNEIQNSRKILISRDPSYNLKKFIQFVDTHKECDFKTFKEFLNHQHDYKDILGTSLGISPAIRYVAANAYQEWFEHLHAQKLSANDAAQKRYTNMRTDGVWLTDANLDFAANRFGIRLKTYETNNDTLQFHSTNESYLPPGDHPEIDLVNIGNNHWESLASRKQLTDAKIETLTPESKETALGHLKNSYIYIHDELTQAQYQKVEEATKLIETLFDRLPKNAEVKNWNKLFENLVTGITEAGKKQSEEKFQETVSEISKQIP